MLRNYLMIPFLGLCLFFQGCAAMEYFDGSSEEEIRRFKLGKSGIPKEGEKPQIEKVDLQKRIDILREENRGIRDENVNEMARLRGQSVILMDQIRKLEEENRRVRNEYKVLAKKTAGLRSERKTPSMKSYQPAKDMRKLKIKVLSGVGDLKSAKVMAKKLRNIGYRITFIDSAPRSNFLQNTIYFAPTFQADAKRLVFGLGSNAILKPLSWPSKFDLVVVTGKNP